MKKERLNVGDWIKSRDGLIGQIRHIGKLQGVGTPRTAIWSDWSNVKWDKRFLPVHLGGQLLFREYNSVQRLTEKEKNKAVKKAYRYLFVNYRTFNPHE